MPKMTMRVILKSGVEFAIKCDKFTINRGGAVFCNPPYGREIGKWVQKAFEEARGGIRLFYLSQRGRTRHIFTITFTGKRKSASCAGGYGSRTTTGTPPIPRPSLQW